MKVILYIISFILIQLTIGAGAAVVQKLWFPKVASDSPTTLLIVSAVSSVLIIALFLLCKWYKVSRTYVRTHPWSIMAWSAVLAIGMMIPLAFLEEFIPEAWRMDLLGANLMKALGTTEGYFVICMLAPLMEEIVFRGAIIRTISPDLKQHRWVALAVSTIAFAVIHANPAQIPHAIIVGLLLGWLFLRTGSIVPGLIIHWLNNSAAYVLMKMFPTLPYDAPLVAYFGGNEQAVYKAVGFSLMIALPALWMLYVLTRKKA